MFSIKSYLESISDFKITRKEVPISIVQENFWSALYSLSVPTFIEDTDRIQLTCVFCPEETYFLNHDRQIVPLSYKASPPFPVGCILFLKERNTLWQIDLPKYPYLKFYKQGNKVTANFVIQDRLRSGLILWGDHKIKKSQIEKHIYIRTNRLKSLEEAVWLEPFPNGSRSVICLTDHPDFDTVPKLGLLSELFPKYNFRITKGVFPCRDPKFGKMEPGLEVPEYKNYIDMIYESGSEIAYHGLSPRTDPPSFSECLRRIEMMGMYSPKTWIDHGCGSYLFSREAVFKEGPGLVETLSQAGVENYWSYTDVWENPVWHLDVWKHRSLFSAFSNFFSFLWEKKGVNVPLMAYYGSSVVKNLLGPDHFYRIIDKPWRMSSWKFVAAHSRRLRYFHDKPMVLYDLCGQSSLMSNQSIWVFDTLLLNHLAFQLRPANIDLLIKQNGLLLAHCYLGYQKNRYGTINCFVNNSGNFSLIPEFIEDVKYISEKQSQRELVTLSFNALRNALSNFVNTSLIRTASGWEINGNKAIVACQQSKSVLGQNKQWCKGKIYYTEVEGQAVIKMSA